MRLVMTALLVGFLVPLGLFVMLLFSYICGIAGVMIVGGAFNLAFGTVTDPTLNMIGFALSTLLGLVGVALGISLGLGVLAIARTFIHGKIPEKPFWIKGFIGSALCGLAGWFMLGSEVALPPLWIVPVLGAVWLTVEKNPL